MEQPTIDKRPSYDLKEQSQIVNLLGQEKTMTEISLTFGRSRSGITYAIQKFNKTGSTEQMKGSGAEIKIGDNIREKILDHFKTNPTDTYKECIRKLEIDCSVSFISKFLKSQKIQAYVPVNKNTFDPRTFRPKKILFGSLRRLAAR